jgi:trehalose/maltose hydrolase-like predicted phosphorylase
MTMPTVTPNKFDAVLFDLDGVITATARIHASAWKQAFDEILKNRAGDEPFKPFDKQADVALAMVLLGDQFTLEQKRRNFDYYDPLTTGDSSLSVCIQSILAQEVGYPDKALEYAHYAVLMDLGNVEGNLKDGCHVAFESPCILPKHPKRNGAR